MTGLYRKRKVGGGKRSPATGGERFRVRGGVRSAREEPLALSESCPGFLWDTRPSEHT